MPGQLFKFTKYFKKDQIKNQPDDTTSQVQEGSTAVTYSQASPSQSPPQAPIQSGQALLPHKVLALRRLHRQVLNHLQVPVRLLHHKHY